MRIVHYLQCCEDVFVRPPRAQRAGRTGEELVATTKWGGGWGWGAARGGGGGAAAGSGADAARLAAASRGGCVRRDTKTRFPT